MSAIVTGVVLVGAITLVGIGLKRYSKNLQHRLRLQFYQLLARTLCDYFNKTVQPAQPYTEAQWLELLLSGKHGGMVPGVQSVKMRISAAEQGAYTCDVLIYKGNELVTLGLGNILWSDLPEDIQSNSICTPGKEVEYLLLN